MYHLPAVDVFDDRAVAAGVGHREVQRRQAVLSGHVVLDNFATVKEAVAALEKEPFTIVSDNVPGGDVSPAGR